MVGGAKFAFITPAPVIAFIIGFVLYAVLAKAGLEPPTVEMPSDAAPAEPSEGPAEAAAKSEPEEKKD